MKELERMEMPAGVEAIDGGVATIDLLSVFQEAKKIIVIDALKTGGKPGTVYRITPEILLGETGRPLSLHEVDFLDVLGMARQLGSRSDVVIIGVEPKEVSWGMELTPEVKAKLPKVIEAVFEELINQSG